MHNIPAQTSSIDSPLRSFDGSKKVYFKAEDGSYEYWYQRATREVRGELRVRIAQDKMALFRRTRTAASPMVQQGFVNITAREAGWYTVTGVSLVKWDEVTGSFHNPLAVWLKAFNRFFNAATVPAHAPAQPVKREQVTLVRAGHKITLQRPAPTQQELEALRAHFGRRSNAR